MIERRRKSLTIREYWFDEPWTAQGADVILFYHWSNAVDREACADVYSLEIDLSLADAEVLRRFTASTRNQINRGAREGLKFSTWERPSAETLGEFLAFYQQFSAGRGLGLLAPDWMGEYSAQDALLLTRATTPDDRTLVWHSYYRDREWARQFHSVSFFADTPDREARNQVGRANRYLHWMDMLECRRLGIEHFDFGGWYHGNSDEKLLRVNSFKEEFGGEKTHRYHSMVATSAKGELFLRVRKHLPNRSALLHVV